MRVRLLCIGAACFCAAKPTDADLVVFEFTGQVTSFDNDNGLWNGHPFAGAAVGQSFALRYEFESTTADGNGNAQVGLYVGAVASMRVTVGSAQFEYDSFSPNRIQVLNDFVGLDDYTVLGVGTDSGDFLHTELGLRDSNGTTFSSDALPTSLVLSDFETRFAELSPGNSGTVAGGPTDSLRARIDNFNIVPVPGAVVLALIGLPMAAWLRRRVS